MKSKLLIFFVLLNVQVGFAQLQEGSPVNARERWESMSEEQRQELRQRHARWKELSSEDKQALKSKYERFRKLPPERQKKIREAFKKWQSFDETKKAKIRNQIARLKKIDPNFKKERLKKLRDRKSQKRNRLPRR